jgi:hypothetical protein
MKRPIQILLQTTIPERLDDWHIERFSLLREFLSSICKVTARNRETDEGEADPVLSTIDKSDFDELWLFAVDTGRGLTTADCEGITRFRQRGGGILATRDHEDLGSSLCTLGGIGRAHYFHAQNPEPDESRRTADDTFNKSIAWPNYHSGNNGDYQKITPVRPAHELLRGIEYFPAHPHEGAVGAPADDNSARVVATGLSKVTGRPFNLVVAFENSTDPYGNRLGRAVAESSFHHFVDYNWDTEMGCPSFLEEPPGDGFRKEPDKLENFKGYVRNLALWLAPN